MNEFPVVLVINCGSSSIKFSVLDASSCDVLMAGIADGINSENAFLSINDGEPVKLAHRSYEGALKAIAFELEKRSLIDSVALIGHRIAHGGNIFTESVVITEEVIDNIRRVSPLAPLHNYANLSGIASAQQLFPGSGRWRCLIPASTRRWRQRPISMGCRGSILRSSACAATVFTAPRIAMFLSGRRAAGAAGSGLRLVIAHLGNGASICAVRNGQSVDTSMGMTPLEGLMMGTRCGDVDFGAMAWVARETNQTLSDLERVVNKESGLLGISGLSSDLRVLEKAWHAGHDRARLAIKTFVHRIARHIAGHAASLHRLDGIIFTGGIGENSLLIRRLVIEHLAVLGLPWILI
jgi:propionate kinase